MSTPTIPVRGEIKLGQFVKLASLAEDGAQARELIQAGDVSVNGEVLDEPYINETIDVLEHMGDLTYPQTVPEGCVFVMGDNRNASTDSRDSRLGMVDERYILGHVQSVVFPISDFGTVK